MTIKLDTSDTSNLTSVIDLMRWGASQFVTAGLSYSHGMSSPLDESVYLVLRTLNLPVDTPDVYWQSKVTSTERDTILEVFKQRVEQRIPSAYITKEGWFAGLKFYVDERVLIPRSPIAELVESQFQPWVNPDEVESILDLCTGCGCIGIACAYAFPHAEIELSDISNEALAVADKNICMHDASNRVTTVQSDLFQNIQNGADDKKYDLIVSNPPYVDQDDMTGLADEFHHEPELALSSGKDGLDFTTKLLSQAAEFLTDFGVLVVEVGNSQYQLADKYPEVPFHWVEFERGGDGVFILTKQELEKYF